MTIAQSTKLSARQKRNLRNAIAVNSLKMASGCARCDFKPQSWAECRLLDLNHFGDGGVGAWATKSQNKHDNVARMVWGGTGLDPSWTKSQKVNGCVRIAIAWNMWTKENSVILTCQK